MHFPTLSRGVQRSQSQPAVSAGVQPSGVWGYAKYECRDFNGRVVVRDMCSHRNGPNCMDARQFAQADALNACGMYTCRVVDSGCGYCPQPDLGGPAPPGVVL